MISVRLCSCCNLTECLIHLTDSCSEGNGNCVNGIENPQGLDASSRTSNVTKSYTTTRHFAEEALAAICSKENTGVNLIFSSAITEK